MALRLGAGRLRVRQDRPGADRRTRKPRRSSLTFFVDPGNRAYVRHINFNGTTSDQRRGAAARDAPDGGRATCRTPRVERSKQRLQRLPYIEKVEVETNAGAGHARPGRRRLRRSKEGLPGQFSGGIGYSESQSFILSGSFVHTQFHGHGQSRRGSSSTPASTRKVYSLSHTDPYTDDRRRARAPCPAATATSTQYISAASDFSTTTSPGRWPRRTASRSREYQGAALRTSSRSARTCSSIRTQQRARKRSTGCSNNGNPYTQMIEREIPGGDPGDPRIIDTILSAPSSTPSSCRRLELRLAQSRAVRRPRRCVIGLSLAATRCPAARSSTTRCSYDYLQFVPI